MTLRLFSIFKQVYNSKSITLAANQLRMAQPAVSLAIKELESYYGTPLFERRNRQIYPTKSGELLLQYVNTILSQVEEASTMLREENSILKCKLGINISVGESYLPDLLVFLKEKYPKIEFTTLILNTSQLEDKVSQNEVDFSLTDITASGKDYTSIHLGSEKMVAVCNSKNHLFLKKLTAEELSNQNLLLRETGSGTRECVNTAFAAKGFSVSPVVESSSTYCLCSCAKAGQGITILPNRVVSKDIARSELYEIDVEDIDFNRNYYMVYHKNKYMVPTLRKIMDSIVEFFTLTL